jgi:hypothetical protein
LSHISGHFLTFRIALLSNCGGLVNSYRNVIKLDIAKTRETIENLRRVAFSFCDFDEVLVYLFLIFKIFIYFYYHTIILGGAL